MILGHVSQYYMCGWRRAVVQVTRVKHSRLNGSKFGPRRLDDVIVTPWQDPPLPRGPAQMLQSGVCHNPLLVLAGSSLYFTTDWSSATHWINRRILVGYKSHRLKPVLLSPKYASGIAYGQDQGRRIVWLRLDMAFLVMAQSVHQASPRLQLYTILNGHDSLSRGRSIDVCILKHTAFYIHTYELWGWHLQKDNFLSTSWYLYLVDYCVSAHVYFKRIVLGIKSPNWQANSLQD